MISHVSIQKNGLAPTPSRFQARPAMAPAAGLSVCFGGDPPFDNPYPNFAQRGWSGVILGLSCFTVILLGLSYGTRPTDAELAAKRQTKIDWIHASATQAQAGLDRQATLPPGALATQRAKDLSATTQKLEGAANADATAWAPKARRDWGAFFRGFSKEGGKK